MIGYKLYKYTRNGNFFLHLYHTSSRKGIVIYADKTYQHLVGETGTWGMQGNFNEYEYNDKDEISIKIPEDSDIKYYNHDGRLFITNRKHHSSTYVIQSTGIKRIHTPDFLIGKSKRIDKLVIKK